MSEDFEFVEIEYHVSTKTALEGTYINCFPGWIIDRLQPTKQPFIFNRPIIRIQIQGHEVLNPTREEIFSELDKVFSADEHICLLLTYDRKSIVITDSERFGERIGIFKFKDLIS